MKLFLTSAGYSNDFLKDEFVNFVGKEPSDTKIAVINSAAIIVPEGKDWHIDTYREFNEMGFYDIDMLDLGNPDIDWLSRLEVVDVVYLSGGNSYYLLHVIKKSGFDKWVKTNKDRFIFSGSSAGTLVFTPNINTAGLGNADKNEIGLDDLEGLGLLDFEIGVHINDANDAIEYKSYAQSCNRRVELLNDKSAVVVSDREVQIISD